MRAVPRATVARLSSRNAPLSRYAKTAFPEQKFRSSRVSIVKNNQSDSASPLSSFLLARAQGSAPCAFRLSSLPLPTFSVGNRETAKSPEKACRHANDSPTPGALTELVRTSPVPAPRIYTA